MIATGCCSAFGGPAFHFVLGKFSLRVEKAAAGLASKLVRSRTRITPGRMPTFVVGPKSAVNGLSTASCAELRP